MYTYSYKLGLDDEYHPVLLKERRYQVKDLSSVKEIVSFFQTVIPINAYMQENVYLITVNTSFRPLGIFHIGLGTADMAVCSPREVMLSCLLTGATGFFVVHNHPSGRCNLSNEDAFLATRMEKAGEILNIRMIDFVIVGKEEYYSWKEDRIRG